MTEFYRFEVSGRVQGVGFRQTARAKALILGLQGWVRNRDDGRVEGCVGGAEASRIAEFRRLLKQGPPAARVETLTWTRINTVVEVTGNAPTFRILPT